MDSLIDVLQAQGIDIITYNVEHGPGQVEINYGPLDIGVAASDRAFVFKGTVKEYLTRQGLLATFMTKPYKGISGSCAHFHISLLDKYSDSQRFPGSRRGKRPLRYVQEFHPGRPRPCTRDDGVWSPTPNCYRRIRPHTYAPSNISWGMQDRSASVRVKASRDQIDSYGAQSALRAVESLSRRRRDNRRRLSWGLRQERELMPAGSGPKEDDSRHAKLPTEIDVALDAFEADAGTARNARGGIRSGLYRDEAAGGGTSARRDSGSRNCRIFRAILSSVHADAGSIAFGKDARR